VQGDIPHVPDVEGDNIRVLAYRVGGGEGGNVAAETITHIVRPEPGAAGLAALTVHNRRAASGGAPAETLEAAQTRLRSTLKAPSRAITTDDYVALALATPSLRVARAMAIPLFAPGVEGYPETQTPATVTIVVVPYSLSRQPTPSEGFLRTVCRHLDRHRLITTQLHVIGPDYVRVQVQAEVVLRPGFQSGDSRDRIASALNAFFHPLEGGPDGSGWPFGRTVYKSEVYQQIEQVDGVDCVHSLRLSGAGVRPSADGNIAMPPYGLVVAGEHRIDIGETRSRVPR
jgi:predicted phage baseplate assembly protein